MPKILNDDSDSEIEIKTDNEYAKSYDIWRKKEELNRLKTKYGEDDLDLLQEDTSSSSDDDEDGIELTEEVEKQFFKTLSCLKNKDPRIYDENVKFFEEADDTIEKTSKKKKKDKPLYIQDYERELILQKNGELSDSDDEGPQAKSPTYVEEQKHLKDSFKKALNQIAEDDDGDWGGILKARKKTEEEKIKEEADYKEWLAGQKEKIGDKEAETELKPLKDYWNNPNLDDGEKFLRDYILQKKFLDREDDDYIPTYEEIVHDSDNDLSEDEEAIEKQEEFEHKYNFRFEEPDQEFIKHYPRTMEHSLRKNDDRRKLKRAETKERKKKEKEQKMQELKKLQELKHKEIEEKIQKLKEITGNTDITFKDEDLDGDFDPEAHDKRMQSLFNDEFYEGAEGDQKPAFPELDEYLELENWERWNGDEDAEPAVEEYAPHCEDEDFNMDCDYDPKASVKRELIENTKGKKKRKRKSLFAEAVSQPKPVFDPNDKTYEEYLDEYYKLDCEDIIGDIPCRFKYRKVVPNSFGLTVEEILMAKDRELNKWCSLKKAVQHRPDHIEKYDQIAYTKKASNIELKKKVLPSLFENEEVNTTESDTLANCKKKRKRKGEMHNSGETTSDLHQSEVDNENTSRMSAKSTNDSAKVNSKQKKEKKKRKAKIHNDGETTSDLNQSEIENENASQISVKSTNDTVKVNGKQKKEKKKKKHQNSAQNTHENVIVENKTKKNKKIKRNNKEITRKRTFSESTSNDIVPKKKMKKSDNQKIGLSDARLSAYGINPKKFKNKLKYNKK